LYEPATQTEISGSCRPLWWLDNGRTLFIGPLLYNAPHQHGAPVYLSSLGGPFSVRLASGPWTACEAAMIPAGVVHELRLDGEPVMVLYAEPDFGGAGALGRFVADADERNGALLGRSSTKRLARELYERADSHTFLGTALDDLLGFGQKRTLHAMDPRAAQAAKLLADSKSPVPLSRLSRDAGVSESRLQHLFKQETGVSLRRYRTWLRMRDAINEIVAGANFTTAAHAAGFADQAHFSHDFRATFGAAPSVSLTNPRDVHRSSPACERAQASSDAFEEMPSEAR